MMLGKVVVEHQGRTVHLEMRVHQAAVVGRVAHQLSRAERLLVEVDGFGRLAPANREVRGKPAFGFLEVEIHRQIPSLSRVVSLVSTAAARAYAFLPGHDRLGS